MFLNFFSSFYSVFNSAYYQYRSKLMHCLGCHFTQVIFTEDKLAMETEQKAYDIQGGDWNQEVFPLILDVRELLYKKGVSLLPKIK